VAIAYYTVWDQNYPIKTNVGDEKADKTEPPISALI